MSAPRRSARIQALQTAKAVPAPAPTEQKQKTVRQRAQEYREEYEGEKHGAMLTRRLARDEMYADVMDFKLAQYLKLASNIFEGSYSDPWRCHHDMELIHEIAQMFKDIEQHSQKELQFLYLTECHIVGDRVGYQWMMENDRDGMEFLAINERMFNERLVRMEKRLDMMRTLMECANKFKPFFLEYSTAPSEQNEVHDTFNCMNRIVDSLKIRRVQDTEPLYGQVLELMRQNNTTHWAEWLLNELIVQNWIASHKL